MNIPGQSQDAGRRVFERVLRFGSVELVSRSMKSFFVARRGPIHLWSELTVYNNGTDHKRNSK